MGTELRFRLRQHGPSGKWHAFFLGARANGGPSQGATLRRLCVCSTWEEAERRVQLIAMEWIEKSQRLIWPRPVELRIERLSDVDSGHEE